MQIDFSVGDLEAFVAVANHLNYRAAAQSLNISPSALSRRIQKLELTLNTQLLVRTTRDVKLSISGMQIYSRSQEVLANIRELLDAGQKGTQHLPSVTVACTNSHAQIFMPVAVERFCRIFPNTPVRVMSARTTEVLDMVRRGDADFGITDMGLQEPSLEFIPTFNERVVLAVPADHQLVGRSRVEWDEIANERFISVWKGAPTRVLLDFELAKACKNISIFHEVRNLHTALGFVGEGLGVSAVTELVALSSSKLIYTIPLFEPEISCPRALIRGRGRAMRSTAKAFWELLSTEWDQIVRSIATEESHVSKM